jgi:hypothetical protein
MERWRIKVPRWLSYWAWREERSPIEKLYLQLGILLRLVGERAIKGQTPSERIHLLTKDTPELDLPGDIFLDEYQMALYSPHPVNYRRASSAYFQLRKLVISLWLKRVLKL